MYRAGEEILLAVSCGDYLPLPERIEEGNLGRKASEEAILSP